MKLTLSNCCMFCTRNLCALYQGRKTSLMMSLTPFSWNLSVSALTTGELIRYNLKITCMQVIALHHSGHTPLLHHIWTWDFPWTLTKCLVRKRKCFGQILVSFSISTQIYCVEYCMAALSTNSVINDSHLRVVNQFAKWIAANHCSAEGGLIII